MDSKDGPPATRPKSAGSAHPGRDPGPSRGAQLLAQPRPTDVVGPTVDFHCHLDLYADPPAAIARIQSTGAFALSVTTTPSAWRVTRQLAQDAPRIATALGLHPEVAHKRIGELKLFDALLPASRFVGEIGLDGSPQYAPHQSAQLTVFRHILRACSKVSGRILTIHSRRAVDEVLDDLESHPQAGVPVLHWFTGNASQLRRAIDLGRWFSVGSQMCSTARGKALVSAMPADRVLTETDGPFSKIKGRAAQPGDVAGALDYLAGMWCISRAEAAQRVLMSFQRLRSTVY